MLALVGKDAKLSGSKHLWWVSHFVDDPRYIMLSRLTPYRRVTCKCRRDKVTIEGE